ncbi:MAG: carboxypeptidase-like regulatory domain-containing protein, partial [Myxococcota bacterium]|nr:carboxypeptidase-like regulatory domain-containing protein [Myxococcota bacterium]
MYNAHAAFVIEGVGRGGGYRYQGGYVVDMAVLDEDGVPSEDRFSEYLLTWNMNGFEPEKVEILNDGRGEGPAHVRLLGKTTTFHFLDSFVGFIADAKPPDFKVNFDYTLGPEDKAISLKITLMNEGDEDMKVKWPLSLAHTGDGGWAYATGAGLDEEGMPGFIPYLGVISRDVSYGVMRPEPLQPMYAYAGVGVYEEDRYTVPAGGSTELQLWFAVTDRSAVGLDQIWRDLLAEEASTGRLTGKVTLPSTTVSRDAWAVVRDSEGDVRTISPVDADGAFHMDLEPGTYTVFAYAHDHAPAAQATVTVEAGSEVSAEVEIPQAAQVTVRVTDPDTGQWEPARVTFIRKGDTPSPHPPSDVALRRKSWSGTISGVAMVVGPDTTITLPAGDYEAVATRGLSYERDWRDVTLSADGPNELDLNVQR